MHPGSGSLCHIAINSSGETVQDNREVHKFSRSANIGNVRGPDLIDARGDDVLNEVGKYRMGMVTIGAPHP